MSDIKKTNNNHEQSAFRPRHNIFDTELSLLSSNLEYRQYSYTEDKHEGVRALGVDCLDACWCTGHLAVT